MKNIFKVSLISICLVFAIHHSFAQLPAAIKITPENASGYQELTLTFFPEYACFSIGGQGLTGLDSIAMHSSAVLINEDPRSWDHFVHFEWTGHDGTLPHLYKDSDTSYSITFNPSTFYGTGDEPLMGINAVFNDCFGWTREGKDFDIEGCKDFHIPFITETASVTFRVNMKHQIFLGNFDPVFDFLDVAGNFNGWGNPGNTLTDEDDGTVDSIYSVTITGIEVGRLIEYKFRKNKTWDTSELPYPEENRTHTVQSGTNILEHYYDNLTPVLKDVLFEVNMNYLYENGLFNPATDQVDIAGTFNNWGFDEVLWMDDPDGDEIYSLVISGFYIGETVEFKFRLNGNWDVAEFPGFGDNRVINVTEENDYVYAWWNDEDPGLIAGPFFADYYDGIGDNNALVITNKTDSTIDLSQLAIVYTTNGSDWSAPVNLTDTLATNDNYLIVNPGFNLLLLANGGIVDMVNSELTSFDGNDAIALVKAFGDNEFRIIDQIGIPSENPGMGWEVAGIPNATKGLRLTRKSTVIRGQTDWVKSAGSDEFNSEWNVIQPEISKTLGTFKPDNNFNNQWFDVEIPFLTDHFNAITFEPGGKGLLVGNGGQAFRGDNFGESGLPVNLGVNHDINDVQIINERNAWVVGNEGTILYSNDFATWEDKGFGEWNRLFSVCFLDSLVGYVGGEWVLLRTLDGGNTWEWLETGYPGWYRKVFFLTKRKGWALNRDFVIATKDGGETWEPLNLDPGLGLRTLFFVNEQKGWVAGAEGLIMFTSDGGQSWNKQLVQTDAAFNELYFASENIGWAVGTSGNIFMTHDGGKNWIKQVSGTTEHLNDISFYSRNNGWIAGTNGTVLSTRDRWNFQESNAATSVNYNSVYFTENGTGWIVGDQGMIMKTMNAGISWDTITKIHHQPIEPHFDIFFSDDYHGWIATSGGFIYKTEDGGKNWTGVHTGSPEWYNAVFFLDETTGWSVAGGGIIARTTNGGDSWDYVSVGSNKHYNDVYFIDENTGWVTGEAGIIIKSTDGGVNWAVQFTPVDAFMNAIWFHDSNHGVAVGSGGTILHTTDGGTNWNFADSPTGAHLNSVFFIDNMTGWACGTGGVVLRTSDGGSSWSLLPTAWERNLFDIFFIDSHNGWVVGENNAIMKTSSSGCSDPIVNLPLVSQICEGENIVFDAGDAAEYEWNTGADSSTIKVNAGGYYKAVVRNICKHEAVDSVLLEVNELPEFQFKTDKEPIICEGETLEIDVDINSDNYELDYSYDWNVIDEDTAKIEIDTAGYFAVNVKDSYGCSFIDSIKVEVQKPWDEKIALVTFDIEDQRNLVVWKPTEDKGTSTYNIYKVQSPQNKFLGSVNFGDLTIFSDATSRPRQQSDRYVITTVDTCLNESFYSASHKTMHLTANKGTSGEANLIWEHYEGIPVNWYYIFRGTDSTSFSIIDSIAYDPSKTQYTDLNPPGSKVYYQIGIKLPQVIRFDDGKKGSRGPFVHSLSNLDDTKTTGLNQLSLNEKLRIYPNPGEGIFNLRFDDQIQEKTRISVYNSFGAKVKDFTIYPGQKEYKIDISTSPKGIYFIMIKMESSQFYKKILIQ
jgi:photosystem II stability/assembly factor-like uncharacterized protein